MPGRNANEIKNQLEQLERQMQMLREKVEQAEISDGHVDLLEHLSEPLSFQQLLTRSGATAEELRECLTSLYVAGKIERWDLPRFVRADLGATEKKELLRQILAETPIRQNGGEALTGLTRGQVSGVFIEGQKVGELARLGPKKGDPWFMSRGTQDIITPTSTEYQVRPKRREKVAETRKPRGRRNSKG